ncbi:MAG: prolipoprotein diacylglyceryl transferase family protein [Fimbriimonadales bacterium]
MSIGSLFTLLGFLAGGAVYFFAARREPQFRSHSLKLAVVGLTCGVLGAKLSHWVASGQISESPNAAGYLFSGRSLIGGLLFGWIGVEIAKRVMGIRASSGPMFALAIPAGESVGRFGCFLNGCCYGTKTYLPWAVQMHGEWRHPSQLYLSVSAALIFFFMLYLHARVDKRTLFPIFLALFGISRFAIEFFRERQPLFAGVSLAQIVCLELSVTALVILYLNKRHQTGATGG